MSGSTASTAEVTPTVAVSGPAAPPSSPATDGGRPLIAGNHGPVRRSLHSAFRIGEYLVLPAGLILGWHLLSAHGVIQPLLLPSPATVARSAWELTVSGELPRHVLVSLVRVLEGFSIATVCGLGLGLAMGLWPRLNRMTDLLIHVLRPIPPIAWIPLAILWFGIGELSKIYIITLGSFFPILIGTLDSVRGTDSRHVELARVFEVSRLRFIRRVVLPGALPGILTSLRLGLGGAWLCVVAAELIAATRGVGYLIMDARQLSQPDVVIVGMFAIGIAGRILDDVLRRLEPLLIPWRKAYAGGR